MSAYALIHCQWSNLVGRRNYSSLKINYRSKEKQKMLVGCLWRQQLRVKKHEPREVTAQEQRVWVRCLFSLSFLQRRLIKAERPPRQQPDRTLHNFRSSNSRDCSFLCGLSKFFYYYYYFEAQEVWSVPRLTLSQLWSYKISHTTFLNYINSPIFWFWGYEIEKELVGLDRLQQQNKLSNLLCRTYR